MTDTFTGETYNALCGDAEGSLAGGAPEQARELLLKAISLIGTRTRARSLLADTCMSMELWPEAREQLEILITLEEGNTRNNFRLGQVLEELGEYQLAADNYSVVLNEDPNHHGALVAIKRIAVRTNDSGVNLVDIFASPATPADSIQPASEARQEKSPTGLEGLQFFADQPSEDVFAGSEGAGTAVTLDSILDGMGMKSSPEGWKSEDVSKLLDDLSVPDKDSLQALFAAPSAPREEPVAEAAPSPFGGGAADLESIFSGSAPVPDSPPAGGRPVPSLEDIFGGPVTAPVPEAVGYPAVELEPVMPEIVEPEPIVTTPEVIEPEAVELEPVMPEIVEPEPIVTAPEVIEPEAVELEPVMPEIVEPEPIVTTSEVIEPEVIEPAVIEPEVVEPEVVEPEVIVPEVVVPEVIVPEVIVPEVIVPEVIVPEVIVPEVVEPEVVEPEAPADLMFSAAPDPAIFGSMDALEAIFSAAAVSKIVSVTGEEPQEAAAVEPADTGVPDVPGTNGIPTVPAPEPVDADASGLEVVFGAAEEEAPAPAGIEEPPVRETAGTPAATEAPAAPDFFVEAWSAESGLVAVTLFSGILPVRSSLIAALETTLSCEPGPGGISRIGGEGTMLLDCGPGEPLMLDAAIGTKVRGAFLAMLPDGDRLLAETRVDGLSEVVSAEGTKLLFGAETPVRKITVEGGTPLLVRAASIAAASPGVEISGDPTLDGYLRAAGQGRVYLIE